MKKILLFTFLNLILFTQLTFSQFGITGTVIDGDFNEPLPFANILVKETGEGATSDFDGKYTLELESGTYTLVFSFVGYETKQITSIEVGITDFTILDVVLNSVAQGLEEVIITVDARQNTESSVLEIQRKSASLVDGISAQTFKKIGSNDLA
ncbi:MAG: carboxypeptidase-like regulatory domain-containing protein, partial [Flavobacteriaceae bacterium]